MQDLLIILVVEDDHVVRSLAEETLSEGGYKVTSASSAEQDVELLGAQSSKFRALATDINLGSAS